mgnify:CR=1 FL=1
MSNNNIMLISCVRSISTLAWPVVTVTMMQDPHSSYPHGIPVWYQAYMQTTEYIKLLYYMRNSIVRAWRDDDASRLAVCVCKCNFIIYYDIIVCTSVRQQGREPDE